MEPSDILTFSAPQAGATKVESQPSPNLELAYAYYFLNRPDSEKRALELPWVEQLYTKERPLVDGIKSFWPDAGCEHDEGMFVFWLVCQLGYAQDDAPGRMFEEFSKLPERALKRLLDDEAQMKHFSEEADEAKLGKEREYYKTFRKRFEALRPAEPRKRYLKLLRGLWGVLKPFWEPEGRAEAARASELFLKKYRETGSVLSALPPHHFTQFESTAKLIETSLAKGRVVVTPLFFASAGGFNFDFGGVQYVGYGIQSERMYEKLQAQVSDAAHRVKALADPTRLMLLTLIARYEGFEMTVGDFARQLGVTQPTVSGHLKLLKEADLITLKKHGNKSLHQINAETVRETLGSLEYLVKASNK